MLLAAVLLLTAGCGGDPPQVTFTAAGTTVSARPTQYCDLKLTDCSADAAAPVQLTVPPGTPLDVSVPDDVAAAPWHVVFSYRDATGQQVDARSPVLTKKEHGFTLALPEPADRLLTAQVQQFGPAPRIDEQTGELEFPVRGSWVLNTPGS
jgi:Protein of unknown function (DUF2771)